MNEGKERDVLLSALSELPLADLDPARARLVLDRARRLLARHRDRPTPWSVAVRIYGNLLEPLAAGALSLGFIAAVVAQAVAIVQQANAGYLWR